MQLRNPILCWLTLALFFCASPVWGQEQQEAADLEDPIDTADILVAKGGGPNTKLLTDADLRERLSYLNGCLELRTNGVVKGYIKTYVQNKPEKARAMLGKRLTYFPLFEQKLREYGLPTDLKYLSVVESALNAKAVSRVGATGLWQFMPATGSDYGLRNNSAVEDRSNPVKSTDAAARYLRDLHKQFGDWALALAAYNSGPGRVNSAIKRGHSRNFWVIQRFLPQETRNYVPAFIAASYLCNFYQEHDLEPYNPDLDAQMVSYIKVYEGLSFRDISDATGIDYSIIKDLNPGFRRDYVPPSTDGNFVIVPQRVMPAFLKYLNTLGSRVYVQEGDYQNGGVTGDGRYFETTVSVAQPESVDMLAQRIGGGISGDHLKTWNKLSSNFVYPNQNIRIWRPVFVQKYDKLHIEAPKSKVPVAKIKPMDGTGGSNAAPSTTAPQATLVNSRKEEVVRTAVFQYHTVRRNESLEDIAHQYATTVENIRKLNGGDGVKFGMRLKIRAL